MKIYGLNVDTSLGEKTQMNHCVFSVCPLFTFFLSIGMIFFLYFFFHLLFYSKYMHFTCKTKINSLDFGISL